MSSAATPRRPASFRLRITLAGTAAFAVLSTLTFAWLASALQAELHAEADRRLASDLAHLRHLAGVRKMRIIQTTADAEARFRGATEIYIRVSDTNGTVLAHTDDRAWDGVRNVAAPPLPEAESLVFRSIRRIHDHAQVRAAFSRDAEGRVFMWATTQAPLDARLGWARRLGVWALAVNVACGAAVIYAIAARAMRRMDRIRATAAAVSRQSLFQRVPPTGAGDEIDSLADAFNAMLARIETLVVDLQHVGDEMAHDLRGAVGRIRLAAETALTDGAEGKAADALVEVVAGCDHLRALIEDILHLARLEAAAAPLQAVPVDVVTLVHELLELYGPVAADAGLRLEHDLPTTPLTVSGDPAALRRLVANLLDNALKFTLRGGRVSVQASAPPGSARLVVADSGPGIPEGERERVFDRFYRGAQAGRTPGTGLGLPMARRIAVLHGGTLTVAGPSEGGSRFSLDLPRA